MAAANDIAQRYKKAIWVHVGFPALVHLSFSFTITESNVAIPSGVITRNQMTFALKRMNMTMGKK